MYNVFTGESITIPAGQQRVWLTPAFYPEEIQFRFDPTSSDQNGDGFVVDKFYIYTSSHRDERDIGFGTAMACHPNAACKTDSMSRLVSDGAVRIRMVMEEGVGWCTGSLVNNTRNDKTPYFLTAHHCQYEFTPVYDAWRFDFRYAADTCPNPLNEPQPISFTGCEPVAKGQASDFLLVRLNQPIPSNAPVTFTGWNRNDTDVPDTTYLVHHPNADIQKFSTCTTNIVIHPNNITWTEGYTTPANHHFHFKFNEGGHEPGSSGGPVFDQDMLLVGTLHGGSSGCPNNNNTFVGRISKSWNLGSAPEERLSNWLDPDGTGQEVLPSLKNIQTADQVDVIVRVVDPLGRPVQNATIEVSGDLENEYVTDAEGVVVLPGINRNGEYTITPAKNTLPGNGLNVLDLVGIQRHLLANPEFSEPWQFIAADATNNGALSVGDIVLILKLLLGKITFFPSSPSWRFHPPESVISNLPAGKTTTIELIGIKIGDVNGTADPQQ